MASKSLGTLTIDLVAKIGGLSQGLNRSEREMKGFQKRAQAIGRDIGKALTIGFTALSGVAALVVANTLEAEKVQAQLAAALKSTGGAAGLTQDQLNGMAEELQNVTTFGDEAIGSAQALLLTFTKIGSDVFPDAIKAALDMSTALGTDLQSAVTQLGKALNDPLKGISALGRAGVQFSQDQKAMIEALVETGRVSDAQRIILEELETQFGGSAVAARDTFGGALEALKNTVSNLLEGDTGGAGLLAAKTAVEQLNAQFSSSQVKSAFAGMIEDATGALAGLIEQFIKWDAIAGSMLDKADTQAAFREYGESLAGVAEEAESLAKGIARLETSTSSRVGFEDKDKALARMRDQLAKKQAILDHFRAQDLAKEKEHVAAVADVQRSTGTPMLSGETQVIGAGDSQFEFGISPRGGGGRKEETQTLSEYLAELKKVADEERAQMERWKGMVAQMEGPLAEAEFEHVQRQREIREAGEEAGATSEQIARALQMETEAYEKKVAAIEKSLDPLSLLLEDMQFELDLLGKTNAERVTELELRRLGIEMSAEEEAAARAAIAAKVEQLEQTERSISAMDDFRASFADNVASVLDGSKSIKDAFKDMVDDLIAQMARIVAQNFTDSLFGEPGQAGGGSAGGWLSSLFGAFTKRATGGPVMSGVPYLVGEQGPELVIPSASGTVIPAGKTAAMMGGATIVQNFSMPGRYDLRTQSQVSADAGRGAQRALARGTA